MADVVVAGSGPAGWAAAAACARAGLETVLVAPEPHARWPATYGMWADETTTLPAGSRWVETAATRVVAVSGRHIPRGYAVLDNDSVLSRLSSSDVRTVAGKFDAELPGRAAAVVIDATGAPPRNGAEQTAFGVILPEHTDQAVFMDWRPPPGFDSATFLYTVPLPGVRTLVEETSLARRPGMGPDELRARLTARGIPIAGGTTERVRITVDLPVPKRRRGVIPFGAAAALGHPATGYSVADTFRLAPRLAEAIRGTLHRGPDAAAMAGHRVLWPPAARAVHLLRRRSLAVLLALPPHRLPAFFEVFFGLPVDLQRRYLGGREDLAGTVAAMATMFRAADRSLRATMARHAFVPNALR